MSDGTLSVPTSYRVFRMVTSLIHGLMVVALLTFFVLWFLDEGQGAAYLQTLLARIGGLGEVLSGLIPYPWGLS
ncbi:hypothetical protein BSP99_02090 [Corynebacterium glutamicum]|nr:MULTISPECIES: hypothetical protein [Corynebacterium]ALP49128.1 hypothetical protein AC079_02220 [Corynebacterium glutamicum]ANR61396.1 hypothetical protein C628_02010 [[Brevibacterium] flavum ZL-1]ANR64395.1 hypothetical protein C627_02015 [Corynebacterium glutamicum ZL-6]ANU32640.1 hypothetical protein BBD29_02045 [Corynebacterium glutamicum]APT06383.1 hypothetical protein BSP99_02090 [Corynebacterium glutamicum]